MNMFPSYICPLCQKTLEQKDKSVRCVNNHCFDFAKEGYVNLLPVQHKHSKDPGDNKQMVSARRAFLEQGYYQELADYITKLCRQYLGDKDSTNILDAGCGEGFYTHQHNQGNNHVYGVDIAKNAIKIAAKKYKECAFSVGTLSQLPFAGQHFDWIYSIYAPILEQEFSRVLKPKGYLLTVTPAENHLIELKQLIYREAKQHDTERQAINNMLLLDEKRLSYKMNFNNSNDLINLLAMTPFAFKTTPELLSELKAKTTFECQADFLIRLYQNS